MLLCTQTFDLLKR